MMPLKPELNRLMQWARQAPEPIPGPMPPGFADQVLRRWKQPATEGEFVVWQQAICRAAWAAAALILFELVLLSAQQLRPAPSYDVTPAFQVVSSEFVP